MSERKLERYRVQRGETLRSIASVFNVSIDNLRQWNKLSSAKVRTGKVLKIYPSYGSVAGVPLYDRSSLKQEKPGVDEKQTTQTPGSHIAEKGETLWSIAAKYKVSLDILKKWNKLTDESILVGQKLKLSAVGVNATTSAAVITSQEKKGTPLVAVKETTPKQKSTDISTTYIVQSGDNLWKIAQKFGLKVDDLSVWNGLREGVIHVGQELTLHAPIVSTSVHAVSPTSKTVKSSVREETDARVDFPKSPVSKPDSSVTVNSDVVSVNAQGRFCTYVVEKGDSIYRIARKLAVSVNDLQKWNEVGKVLSIGDELKYMKSE